MTAMASQITSLTIVYSTIYSGADQRKHQSSASLAFVRGIHRWNAPLTFQNTSIFLKKIAFDTSVKYVSLKILQNNNHRSVSVLRSNSETYETVFNDQMVNHFGVLFDKLLSDLGNFIVARLFSCGLNEHNIKIGLLTTRVIYSKIVCIWPLYSRMSFHVQLFKRKQTTRQNLSCSKLLEIVS